MFDISQYWIGTMSVLIGLLFSFLASFIRGMLVTWILQNRESLQELQHSSIAKENVGDDVL